MITPADFIHLPYTPDLTPGGIAYACRSLAHTYNRMGGTPFERLRRIVAGKAVELAFRRLLVARQVPFDTLGATPFTDPDRYDVALGGRRVDVKSTLLHRKELISQVRRRPETLLGASALIPVDQIASETMREGDIYLFAFVSALVSTHSQTDQRALEAGQPTCFIYPMPAAWSNPPAWQEMGQLTLKADNDAPIRLEIGGQDASHHFVTEQLELPPRRVARTVNSYYSLAYLQQPVTHTAAMPRVRVGVRSPRLGLMEIALPFGWGNIWVYGMDILLAGWHTSGEFRRQAQPLPAGSRVFQYPLTRTDNLALPVRDLEPIPALLESARAWGRIS